MTSSELVAHGAVYDVIGGAGCCGAVGLLRVTVGVGLADAWPRPPPAPPPPQELELKITKTFICPQKRFPSPHVHENTPTKGGRGQSHPSPNRKCPSHPPPHQLPPPINYTSGWATQPLSPPRQGGHPPILCPLPPLPRQPRGRRQPTGCHPTLTSPRGASPPQRKGQPPPTQQANAKLGSPRAPSPN